MFSNVTLAASPSSFDDGDWEDTNEPDEADELINNIAIGKEKGFPMNREYLPHNRFRELVNRDSIKTHLPDKVSEAFLDFVLTRAPKIFAIVLCCGFSDKPSKLAAALRNCRERGISDDELPIPVWAEARHCVKSGDPDYYKCRWHALAAERTTSSTWSAGNWDNFRDKQWQFLAPTFDARNFEYKLHDQHILPIYCGEEHKKSQGHFSDVVEGFLHSEHEQGFPGVYGHRRIAIKKFRDSPENIEAEMPARRAFEQESRNLKELSRREHPNIVQQMAAIELGQRYYLLSPWADGGDLRTFWQKSPEPALDRGLIMEALRQLRGVVSAIDCLHSGNWEGSRSRRSARSPSVQDLASNILPPSAGIGEIQIEPMFIDTNDYEMGSTMVSVPSIVMNDNLQAAESNETQAVPNWRHGDLKPENILVFPEPGTTLGTLRVSDLGLAKLHAEATSLRKIPSSTKFGTQAYEPPEAVTDEKLPRSRLYDIWSFGCITLEFLVWLLYGREGLQRFERLPIGGSGTLFYTLLGHGQGAESAKVNDLVTSLMDHILAHDPECTGQGESTAVCDLLHLVKDHALVVALPDPSTTRPTPTRSTRAGAAELVTRLEKIIEKSRTTPKYLFTGQDRSSVHFPDLQGIPMSASKTSGQLSVPTGGLSLAQMRVSQES